MAEERFERDPDGARELVEKARDEAKLALAELRDLARGMRPALLAERGLPEAIRALASRTQLPTAVSVEPGGRVAPAVESAAYFVVAEALTNAVKHSHAARLTVDVTRDGDLLVVQVADDGEGGADAVGQRPDRPAQAHRGARRRAAHREPAGRRLSKTTVEERHRPPAAGHRIRPGPGDLLPSFELVVHSVLKWASMPRGSGNEGFAALAKCDGHDSGC